MSKLDEIHRLFKLTSVSLKDSDSIAIEKLADLLDEQEEVTHAAQGSHKGDTGILITTQSRLLFAGLPKGKKTKSDLKVVGIPYERVEAVEYGDSRGTGVLFVVSSGIKSEFSCDVKQVKVIAEHIHAGAPSPAPLAAGKRPSTSPAVKAIAFVLIALVGINLLSAMFADKANKSAPHMNLPETGRAETLSYELDSCFLAGKSAATVYISDMARYSSGGLMPSTVMEEGCARKGASSSNPEACVSQCKLGFRKVAREALK